nr:rubrerythrin family protein [Syntrophorhabdus aromaticivorans]
MANLKGTRTEQNLLKAFAGESQARNRYTYFSSQAKKEGYEQICWIFADTADNEKEHAKRFFKFLEGSDLEITASLPSRNNRDNGRKPQSRSRRREPGMVNPLPGVCSGRR